MRPENKRMQEFLRASGINAVPKYIFKGSLRGSWRLYGIENKKDVGGYGLNKYQKWTLELAEKLTALGFRGLHGPLGIYDGNGGVFSVFVRGHNNFLTNETEVDG